MSSIIKVEKISKQFIIGHEASEQYTTLRDVISKKTKRIFSFSDAGNKRRSQSTKEVFYALNDINFEIEQGDRLGIIGRNGAGKSTLLKVLSRITEPTTGRITIRGRIASLLEVGTGFHPELSGRENIFLNGAILGMSRVEIRRKFDEIVEFAEIFKFLDTPVKRYSSGMYVRLAFAVAAHLEPEILIVDEVLAVGDIQFQKKCLGKMEDVSKNEGRTVIFVSHNMAAIQTLTNKGIVLNSGNLTYFGDIANAIQNYSNLMMQKNSGRLIKGKGMHSSLLSIKLLDKDAQFTNYYIPGEPMIIEFEIETDGMDGLSWELFLCDQTNQAKIAISSLYQLEGKKIPNKPGVYRYTIQLNPLLLASGNYFFDFASSIINVSWDHYVERVLDFEIPYFNSELGGAWDFKSSLGFGNFAITCKNLECKLVNELNYEPLFKH
jgi:lipopolysaccharide transport system ATP-binding protein